MKWMKAVIITGVVCCLAGIGVMVAGTLMGGDTNIFHSSSEWFYEGAARVFPTGQETELTFDGVRGLKLEVHADFVEVVEESREDGSVRVVWESEDLKSSYQWTQEDGTLKLERRTRPKFFGDRVQGKNLTVYVPDGYRFGEIDIEGKAGSFYAKKLYCDNLKLEADASRIQIESGEISRLDVECSAGLVEVFAPVDGDVNADCRTGQIQVALAGDKDSYNYGLECRAGSITLEGSEDYGSGISWSRLIDNGADRDVDLECKAGEIVISYGEQE